MKAAVRAVIVRWQSGEEIVRCMSSLLAEGGPHLAHVVVVDSGSGDGGASRLASKFPDVEVVALDDNLGFAAAANRGADDGSEPLLLFLNPDIEVGEGAVDALAEHLEAHPRAAGAVPLLEGLDGNSQHRWQLRRLPGTVRLALGLPGAPAFLSPPDTPAVVAQPAAAAWMVRRPVWRALDGFDPTFAPAWWEDVDFCARLRRRLGESGFPADEGFLVVPAAHLRHGGGSSVALLGRAAFLSAYHTNLLRYAARHHPGRLLAIRGGLQVSLLVRLLLQPTEREALSTALAAIRTATPSGR